MDHSDHFWFDKICPRGKNLAIVIQRNGDEYQFSIDRDLLSMNILGIENI